MYSQPLQQQQQQPQLQNVPYTNFQQPYNYSSNPSLHLPRTDPVANSTLFDASSYAHNAAGSQNWVVNYDAASTVSSSLPSTWNGTWLQQHFVTNSTAMLPNQTKVTKLMRCEVCKIDCNSKDVYDKHILGKKHKKNAQIQANPTNTSSNQGVVLTSSMSSEGKPFKSGASADSAKVCEVCNILCNSQEVYNKHLYGKKHAAQVQLMSNNGIGPYIAAFKRQGVGPWQKAVKKVKVAQPAWCDVCQVNCNSNEIYISHLAGKKHLKNLEKLSQPKIEADAGATATNASQLTTKAIIGPQEKPGTDKPKPKKAPEIDIEAKKRKVVEGGVAAAAIKLCSLCNVVCNSEVVFNDHLSGHKHAAMVKKLAGETTG